MSKAEIPPTPRTLDEVIDAAQKAIDAQFFNPKLIMESILALALEIQKDA
jgi:hypothetical protein